VPLRIEKTLSTLFINRPSLKVLMTGIPPATEASYQQIDYFYLQFLLILYRA
jgi:hypothetical protein